MSKEAQELRTKKQEKENLELVLAYRHVFATEMGKVVLADLIKRYDMRPSFSDNALRMAFNEGERNVVLVILKALNIDEQQLQQRIKNV